MLRLIEDEPGLWERFQREPARTDLSRSVPTEGSAPPLVLSRWERSRELGVAAVSEGHPVGVPNHDLVVRRDAALAELRDGYTLVAALEAEVTRRGLLAVVSDADGVIVRARGGDLFPEALRRTRLVEGARWDEGARGTNAIGTAIAEAQAVAVVGRAHFETVNHGLFCYAAPVRGAFGERVAVLDVTGPVAFDQAEIGVAVGRAAAALEDALRAHAYAQTEVGSRPLLERMIDRSSSAAILLEWPGVVRKMNFAASAELDGGGAQTVERLFGIGWDDLIREAAHGPAVFETRRRRFRVEFEPVRGVLGRTLALLCFLETESTHGRPRAPASVPPPSASSVRALPTAFDPIVAHDPGLLSAKQVAARLAPSDLPVLLLAETGTGKELFAHAIYGASKRASGPFVALNCGALTSTLLESELFGYAPGAFTGANRAGAEGKLAAAHRGTLFLDEIADMPAPVQAMLLRFLEDGTYSRLGEAAPRHADVRLICATCRDLPKLVENGAFRRDLFFRIQGGCIRLPPLRERIDRLELARALVRSCAAGQGAGRTPELTPSAESWILGHSWPGNVRELRTAILHAIALAGGEALSAQHFPEPLLSTPETSDSPRHGSRREGLKAMAEGALTKAGGNVSEAARVLGVARSTLYRMLEGSRKGEAS
ncbi:MAG TPA: sigma 54-interacting transcriptional regulator [Polyangiaceae bacterium]